MERSCRFEWVFFTSLRVYLTFAKSIWFIKLRQKLHASKWMRNEMHRLCAHAVKSQCDVLASFFFLVSQCEFNVMENMQKKIHKVKRCSNTNKLLISNKVLEKLNKNTPKLIWWARLNVCTVHMRKKMNFLYQAISSRFQLITFSSYSVRQIIIIVTNME